MMNYTVEILKRVKSLLSECGWVRGEFGYEGLGYCLIGAHQTAWRQIKDRVLDEPIGPDGNLHEVRERRAFAVDAGLGHSHAVLEKAIFGDRVGSLVGWNDQECASATEAIATVDRAIGLAETNPEAPSVSKERL